MKHRFGGKKWIAFILAHALMFAVLWQFGAPSSKSPWSYIQGFDRTVEGSSSISPDQSTPVIGNSLSMLPSEILHPNLIWVNIYGLNSTLDKEPLPIGTLITVLDPDGTLIGSTVVKSPGRYGIMPLYGDDPNTPEDEGALPGDILTFKIEGASVRVIGRDKPVWTTALDTKRWELAARSIKRRGDNK